MTVQEKIKLLLKQLSPNGRAFRMRPFGDFDKFADVHAKSFGRASVDISQVLDYLFPDNTRYNIETATEWMKVLGIFNSGSLTLEEMTAAIISRWLYPNNTTGSAYYYTISLAIQAAGFAAGVYENRFYEGGQWITKTPEQLWSELMSVAICGVPMCGETECGTEYLGMPVQRVVQYISEEQDSHFSISPNMRCTFFVASSDDISVKATLPLSRKDEFRQLLIQLKPIQAVGLAYINYT